MPAKIVTPETQTATLQAEKDQLSAEITQINNQLHDLRHRMSQIDYQLAELSVSYRVGDIVADELGVQYRVTGIRAGSRPNGIRLSKTGIEAHKDPRTIWSSKITKVEVDG